MKQNVTFAGTNALPRYTSSGGSADTCLAAARVSSSSASGTAVLGLHRRPIHCRAPASQPSRGRQRRNRAARLAEQTRFAPNTETFSALHNISVVCLSRLARSPGGLGGREPVAAQSPERSFFFPLFLSPRKKKRLFSGDAVTKSLPPNQKNRPHRTASIIYPFSKVLRGSGGFFSKNPPAFLIHTLSNLPEPLADYVACRGYHDKSV